MAQTYLSSLSERERKDIDEKVNFELEQTNYSTLKKMTVIGGLANILGGLFVVWVLYYQEKFTTLLGWYLVLIILNIVNIAWSAIFAYRYENITIALLKKWHKGLYFIFTALCLTWGLIGVLFTSQDPRYQLYVITFLQVVVLSYSFASIFDFVLALLSISCLLLPTISYQVYETIQHAAMPGYDHVLNLSFGISLFILGSFLLVVCYIGYRLTVSQATLSFLNAALNEKLENMNKFLEQRVQERTFELENSLKLVKYQATHDLLTDLPNQRLLLEYLESSIESANQNNRAFAVIVFSLNELEKINDGLGHQAGDLVIKTVAQRLQQISEKFSRINLNRIRYIITLSRKDVFVILLDQVLKLNEIETNVENIFSILDEPIHIEKQVVKLTASIGVSVYPRDGRDIKSLLMNADAAMLRAKQQGGNSLNIYEAKINADISKQLEIESQLHTAIKKGEFSLQYQPFIDLKTGMICGAEALVRWEHASLGFVSPTIFIPMAEANGVIIPLGEWVLRTACMQAKRWHELGFDSLKVAVNLSAKQLRKKNIIEIIANILKETGLQPEYLELELTESEAFRSETIPILKQFKAMGLNLSIDDFGTGFSGLTNLKLFAIDKLKIDQSFIRDVTANTDSQAIVANTIDLAKKINVKIVGEGVETKEQLKFLIDHNCDMIQGYYFSEALNPNAFIELLMSGKKFVTE